MQPASSAGKRVRARHGWFCFSLVEKVARVLLTNHRAKNSKTKSNANTFDTPGWKPLHLDNQYSKRLERGRKNNYRNKYCLVVGSIFVCHSDFFYLSFFFFFSLADDEHYLELLMRISGGKRLSLPSPNPADSPLVRCGTVKIAQKAANVINETKRKNEEDNSR